MSLTGALSNAFSGLTANARAAGLVSGNISNALTEGYGRRELSLSSQGHGMHGGVAVNGVVRHGDPALLSDRRISDAGIGLTDTLQNHSIRMERAIGAGDDPASLVGRIGALENALITAGSNPSSEQRLESVSRAADAIADTLNALSDDVQSARSDADRSIGFAVEAINRTLKQVDTLNGQIAKTVRLGRDPSSLLDTRQKAIDSISEMVPLRSVARDDGVVALFTQGGAILVDGTAAELSFMPTPLVQPHMTQGNGMLSGIMINNRPVSTAQDGPLGGGSLAAQFQVRDEETVRLQAQFDGIARDLTERFDPGGPDGSLAAGQPGIFTDAGVAFDSTDEVGYAGRIRLNAAIDADTGEVWRLRDGLAAATPGEVGDATLLQGIHAALNETRTSASPVLGSAARSASGFASEVASDAAATRVQSDAELSFAQAQNLALKELELTQGVDSDQELQLLMQIEQNYTANARVMSVVDDMMQAILAI